MNWIYGKYRLHRVSGPCVVASAGFITPHNTRSVHHLAKLLKGIPAISPHNSIVRRQKAKWAQTPMQVAAFPTHGSMSPHNRRPHEWRCWSRLIEACVRRLHFPNWAPLSDFRSEIISAHSQLRFFARASEHPFSSIFSFHFKYLLVYIPHGYLFPICPRILPGNFALQI